MIILIRDLYTYEIFNILPWWKFLESKRNNYSIVICSNLSQTLFWNWQRYFSRLASNNYSIEKNDSLCVLTVSCVLLLETCKLGLIEDCIIIASNYVIFPWNWFIFTYTGTEDDTIDGPLVILVGYDLTMGWVKVGMNRGSYTSWRRPQHLSISPKKCVKRQFEACWNLFGIQISAFRATYCVLQEFSDNWKQFVVCCIYFCLSSLLQ